MEEKEIGHCKHGEFILMEGCVWCIEEQRAWETGQSTGNAPPTIASTTGPIIVSEPFPQEFPTAVIRVEPGKDEVVVKLLLEVMRIKEWADKLVVASVDDAKKATDDLSMMGKLKKAVEEKRQEYIGPLNAHVDAVNGAFKLLTGPMAEAYKTARGKVTAYKLELERRHREAEEVNQQAVELARKQAELNQGEFTVNVTPVAVPEAPRLTRTDMGTSGLTAN